MKPNFFNKDKKTINDQEDPDNIPLRNRPQKSIRAKITISFSLFFIFCCAITSWSYWILTQLEHKIDFLEITDNYMVEIQQARRFEKNYLLYSTDLNDALEHIKKANTILKEHNRTIEAILGKEHFNKMIIYMAKYHDQLALLGDVENDQDREKLVPMLREYGSQMVSFAEEIVKKERSSVARMLLLAKRVPLYFIFVLLILVVFVVNSLVRQVILTLKRFMDYTKRIGEGDFSPIVPVRKYRDEFTKLAEAFNRMTKELNHRHEILLESHKLRAIGTLVAGVAHELNNPLNNTLLTASMLKEDFKEISEDEKLEMIDDLINETERSQRIVKDLLDFARESETLIKPLNIDEIVNDSVRLVANQVRLAKIKLDVEFEENLPRIHGDEQMLKQVFVNLILNAVDALSPGGNVRISVQRDKLPGYLLVTVQDDGPGIPEHIQSRIFEPFFTTKGQGKGTGLGLSVCRGIIRKLGGYIHLKGSSAAGTTFTVSLPITDSPSEMMSR
ncbi:MAG: HAMP domain-containing histidine kinase [Proteobacteria bacterium]|nr:HAMP domain-containing histidine kinase [Pseudomonadota bacterium]